MTDVVPGLNESVTTTFRSLMSRDRTVARINNRIRDGTATLTDAHKYAERTGVNLSQALQKHITANTLPDGKFYYNIANRTVRPALRRNYELVNETAAEIQEIVDDLEGIGMDAVMADFPEERVTGLIDKITEAEDVESALRWLLEPIINTSESFADDYMKANAAARYKAGLSVAIVRTAESGSCKWCRSMAGSWDYGDEPKDVYRRHEFCRCAVTYQDGRSAQNVWSKKQWESSAEEMEERFRTDRPPTMSVEERQQAMEQRAKDLLLKTETLRARQARAQRIRELLDIGAYDEARKVPKVASRRQIQNRINGKAWRQRNKRR